MSVSVRTEGNKLQAGASQAVVETDRRLGNSWDVEPDGQRFLIIRDEQSAARPTMAKFTFHWFGELKRLAPRKMAGEIMLIRTRKNRRRKGLQLKILSGFHFTERAVRRIKFPPVRDS
jgi:hypothetical protein